MGGESITRPRYFEGQLLSAADLQAEQDYHTAMRRRHNRDLHGWGVVEGLEVGLEDGGRITVSPGMAIDGHGREIVVPEEASVDPGGWKGGDELTLCLRYAERPGGETPSLKREGSGSESSRIEESFELTLEPGIQAAPARMSDEGCASALWEDGGEVGPPAQPEIDDGCVVLATVSVSDEGVAVDASTHRRRILETADLHELILCLARRVRALERAVGSEEQRRQALGG